MADDISQGVMLRHVEWEGPSIDVISLGCGGSLSLRRQSIQAISDADVIFGADHHFEEISEVQTNAKTIHFPSPFQRLANLLLTCKSSKVVVLASGDALFFGIGSWLNRVVGNEHLSFHANVSSVQLCFHELGLPWQDAKVVSLHGRPLSTLNRYLQDQKLLAVLTDRKANPMTIAQSLVEEGFGSSVIWVCEAVGSSSQSFREYTANDLSNQNIEFHNLNICIVKLSGSNICLPAFPGIPDHCFSTGAKPGFGMISKREVRLAILTLMQPEIDEVAWDVGAGCGGVSVEWAKWNPEGLIYAIENNDERMSHLMINNDRFGTRQNLTPIQGTAPECCDYLPDPDCIFIGGSSGDLIALADYAWSKLTEGGKLVASAVTEESHEILNRFWLSKLDQGYQGEWLELEVAKNLPNERKMRQLKPVALMKCIKSKP